MDDSEFDDSENSAASDEGKGAIPLPFYCHFTKVSFSKLE